MPLLILQDCGRCQLIRFAVTEARRARTSLLAAPQRGSGDATAPISIDPTPQGFFKRRIRCQYLNHCLGHADHHRSSPWVAACSPAVGPPYLCSPWCEQQQVQTQPLTLPGRLEAIAYLTMCLLNYTLVYGLPLLGVQAMLVVWWWGRESWLSKLHLLGKLSLFVFARVIESRFVLFSNELFHLEAMTDRSQPKKRSLRTVQLLVDITLTQWCAVSQKSERSYSSRVN